MDNGYMPSHHLALDLGAESGRAVVGTLDRGHLSLSETHRFANLPVGLPDGLHWDVLCLWRKMKRGLPRASLNTLWGAWVSTPGAWTLPPLDRKGDLLANPFHYRDDRTKGMIDEAFVRFT